MALLAPVCASLSQVTTHPCGKRGGDANGAARGTSYLQNFADQRTFVMDMLIREPMRQTRYQGAIIQDDKMLLIRHMEHESGRSYWVIPGGGREVGETEMACVRRELWEETNLTVHVERLLVETVIPIASPSGPAVWRPPTLRSQGCRWWAMKVAQTWHAPRPSALKSCKACGSGDVSRSIDVVQQGIAR